MASIDELLHELLESERAFVHALRCGVRLYYTPLSMVANAERGRIVSHEDLDAIFANYSMLAAVHEKLTDELEAAQAAREP